MRMNYSISEAIVSGKGTIAFGTRAFSPPRGEKVALSKAKGRMRGAILQASPLTRRVASRRATLSPRSGAREGVACRP
jgi:hypothetical protein